jgi:ABC-type lipoprotein release transport system permease subunit
VLISSVLGLMLGISLFRLLSLINFSFIPAAGLFLEGGHLRFSLDPKTLVANVGLMLAAALFAAWGPSRQAAHIVPADALRNS